MYGKIKFFIEHKLFNRFIITLIVLNGIILGLETSKEVMEHYGDILVFLNSIILVVFVIEIVLRIFIYRLSFFKDPWSLFDFFVVAISLVPSRDGFEALRVLRVLRLFRLVTVIPQMRKVVSALAAVIPGMLSIVAILSLFFYVFAIMATQLFSEKFPEWFGTLGASLYSLFQIMTLESWSMGIVRPVMEEHPNAWLFFIIFIFIASFVMVNLIIAIVVDAMSQLKEEEEETIIDEIEQSKKLSSKEFEILKNELNEIKKMLSKK